MSEAEWSRSSSGPERGLSSSGPEPDFPADGPESEFRLPAGPWTAPEGAAPGVAERVLAESASGHRRTALVRWAPGTDTSAQGVARHDFWEEVYLLEGSLYDLTLDETFRAGMYACRPPGMPHGPWTSAEGVTMLVFTYAAGPAGAAGRTPPPRGE
ncbi:cupin domain-containing protein [Streptomyces avermitilis]|uniref:cupin domain-containing protein n=1 Tax=Streptomyces avermitilis TaxID=33903 RepID=UPI0038229223